MIQLYLNNQEVTLPPDFGLTLTRENTHITKRGDYTLDVTLSLLDPVNAKIFQQFHRINAATAFTALTAILICDSKEELNGTATITALTDISVTVQLLADNSAFNFLINSGYSDKKIWTLDFGTETAIDYVRALASINGSNPNENFVCAPVIFTDKTANDYQYEAQTDNDHVNMIGCNNIIMQPKLIYMVEKLFSILGYSVNSNALRIDSRAKKMFILNPIQSLRYSDCLPDWTTSDFLSEVEKIFNVEYLVDTKAMTVDIAKRSLGNVLHYIPDETIENSYEKDPITNDTFIETDYKNIGYSLPDIPYFKYQHLSEEVKNNSSLVEVTDRNSMLSYVATNNITPNSRYIFKLANGDCYIYTQSSIYNEVDKFRDVVTDKAVTLNQLKIVPSAMGLKSFTWVHVTDGQLTDGPGGWPSGTVTMKMQIPLSSRTITAIPPDQTMTDMIVNGQKTIGRDSVLSVAMFVGIKQVYAGLSYNWPVYVMYPISCVDNHYEIDTTFLTFLAGMTSPDLYFEATDTMRLYVDNCIFKEGVLTEQTIDSTNEYIFNILLSDTKDITGTWVIRNKKFVCVKLEITVEKGRKNPLVKGYFYPDNS